MYVFFFLKGKSLKDNHYMWIKTIAISYIYLAVLEWLKNVKWIKNIFDYWVGKLPFALKQNLCLIILSITLPYICYRITLSDKALKVLELLKINTTFYDNEIEMLSDFDKGAWLCVYLKDDKVVYEGSLGYKELEEDRRKYICLNSYYKYFLDKKGKPKEPYIEDHGEETGQTVMIFYESIKRIEKRS